jgi:hypothetical protein
MCSASGFLSRQWLQFHLLLLCTLAILLLQQLQLQIQYTRRTTDKTKNLYYYLSVYCRRPHWPVVHGSALSARPPAALFSIDVVFHLTLSARLPSPARALPRSLRPRNHVAPRVPFHP